MTAACSDDAGGTEPSAITSSTTTTAPSIETTTTTRGPTGVSTDFARAIIELDGRPLSVAIASTAEQRAQGLMGVEDLGSLDGMLFVFERRSVVAFWMKDTLIPLDIAFFEADGSLVSVKSMTPCVETECPTYSSELPAQYALEAPQGSLEDLPVDARLVVIGGLDGIGKEI